MSGYRISELAGRTGIPATTLRYYEDIGVVPPPERGKSGYRVYDDRAVARFEFVAHAKALGLSLDEVRTLVGLWDGDQCAPVQQQMARLVEAKIFDTARRSAELVGFAHELQAIAARLRHEPASGRCDDACACVAAGPPDGAAPVTFIARSASGDEAAIACTLANAEDVRQRVEDWQRSLAAVTAREAVEGGLRLVFPSGEDTAVELSRLVAAELACCAWVDFTLRLTAAATVLEVRAPTAGQAVLASLFGVAA